MGRRKAYSLFQIPLATSGFTLIEAMLIVVVVSICLLSVMKFTGTYRKSYTQSALALNAQASAEALLQQIKLMKWDKDSVSGQQLILGLADVGPGTGAPRIALEQWNGYTDLDASMGRYGPFTRKVTVDFVQMTGGALISSVFPTDRKRVTVQAVGPSNHSTATVVAIFYNLP